MFIIFLLDHFGKFILCDDGNAELLCFTQLASGIFPCQHIAGLFRHRAGGLAAVALDNGRGLVAGKALQGAGQHKGFSGKSIV